MRLIEKHEMKLIAGGLTSAEIPDWYDPTSLQALQNYQNGSQFDESTTMGEQFSQLMSSGQGIDLYNQWEHTTTIHDLPTHADGSLVDAITALIFKAVRIDTGFDPQTGLRVDGLPAGAGCGDKSTDWIVPDKIWGIDLTPYCSRHDVNYANQIGKDLADSILKADIYKASIDAGAPEWAASVLSNVYYTAVHNLGDAAYKEAAVH